MPRGMGCHLQYGCDSSLAAGSQAAQTAAHRPFGEQKRWESSFPQPSRRPVPLLRQIQHESPHGQPWRLGCVVPAGALRIGQRRPVVEVHLAVCMTSYSVAGHAR